jgi:hypothetical protein
MGNAERKGRTALLTLMVLGALIYGFSASRFLDLSCAVVFLTGAAMIGVFATVSSLVQLMTPNEMRGRVMSVYNVAFRGGMPIGSLATGALTPIFSVPLVLAANGILLTGLGAYYFFVQRKVAAL